MELNDILRNLRTKKKITQQEMAEQLNITQATYNRYEKGTREPDIKTLIKIADYYEISLDLLTGRYKRNSE